VNRRTPLAIVTAGVLLLTGTTIAQTHAALPPTSHTHMATQSTSSPRGIKALRHAAGRFRNLQRAENAGYGFFTDAKGIACIAMPGMGGMGVHFVKSALVGDPAEQIRHPEAMVYRVDANGALRLAAAEYVVIASAWDATHKNPPRLFGHRFMLTAKGNRYGLPAFYSLHAWAWYHNPAGTFAMFNPRVTC
jgi:hypothetical protein